MAQLAKGSGSGLALLGLAVAGVFAWRKRDQITAAAKDASTKINDKMKAAQDGMMSGSSGANDIPVNNAV